MDSHWLELIAIVILILANGFFAASEYALISARRSKISQFIKKGNKKAELVERLHAKPNRLVAAIQVGITLVGTLASVVGGATLVKRLNVVLADSSIGIIRESAGSIAITVVVLGIGFLTLVFGELVPKRLGLKHAERISLAVARTISIFMMLAYVPVKILTLSSRLVLKIIRQDSGPLQSVITEDEIVHIISEGRESGEFSQTEHDLIESVFEFTESTVHKVMTPRMDISAINVDWDASKALRYISEEGFSRYPVFRDSIDNVIGMIYTRDIINILLHSGLIILQDIMRTPFFVPDSKGLTELLKDFQRKQMHMAIVLDEFGGTAGVVTLEDIMEEIVGEIWDEYDAEEPDYRFQADGSVIISSRMSVGDLNKLLDTRLPEDGANTMGGFIYNHLGDIPALNQRIEYGNIRITVTEKTGHQIDKLKVEIIES
ncbi:MAG: hemolysin family protein [Candidatus Zixiibacteriota bacterium]